LAQASFNGTRSEQCFQVTSYSLTYSIICKRLSSEDFWGLAQYAVSMECRPVKQKPDAAAESICQLHN